MGRILIRNLDDELIRKLKARAKSHGRSAEAEVRELLKAALSKSTEKLGDLIGGGKHIARTPREIDRYIKKLRSEWR